MAIINRAPFNALVDDDGSNTVGTPWNKQAISDVILVPVDQAIGAAFADSGAHTPDAPSNLATIPIPALGMRDTVEVWLDVWVAGPIPATLPLRLYATSAAEGPGKVLLDITSDVGAGDVTSYRIVSLRALIRPTPNYPNQFITTAQGFVMVDVQVRGFVFANNTPFAGWVSPWTLFVQQMSAGTNGTPLNWNCEVFLRRAQ